MNVLLTGADGFIGRNIAAALRDAGHDITPVSRRRGVDFSQMLAPGDWLPLLKNVDAVINAVGIIGETPSQRFTPIHTTAPIALFQACTRMSVRRVVQISALGADESALSAYHLSKRAADDELRRLDLDWLVLRPSLIFGRGGGSATLFMRLARLPLIPVIDGGQQTLQPIHIGDVVDAVAHCLATSATRQTVDLVGPETVTFSDWLQRMRKAQGLAPTSTISVPFKFALAAARIAGCFNPILQPENLRMLQRGYTANTSTFVRLLNREPHDVAAESFFADSKNRRTEK